MKVIRKPRFALVLKSKELSRCSSALDRLFERIDSTQKANDAFGWSPEEYQAMEKLMYKLVNVAR